MSEPPGEREAGQAGAQAGLHGGGAGRKRELASYRHPDPGVELLIRAGVVLATSLHDPETTMRDVAWLTVPGLGDMCVIDLLDETGTIKDVAVAAADERLEKELERLRAHFPLSAKGEHPVARVIRSGKPLLIEHMDDRSLESYAESDAHARFMIEHSYRSAVVAPLVARDRTLGAISVLRFGDSKPYTQENMELVRALAWRAALAIDNARLFSELSGLEERMEAILRNVAEAITVMDAEDKVIFANQAAADLLRSPDPDELVKAPMDQTMERFTVLSEDGSELDLQALPSRRVFAGERPGPVLVRNIVRGSSDERWLVVRSSPVCHPDSGEVLYAVNIYEDVTEIKHAQLASSFLSEASRVLASSLDYRPLLQRVAQLAVPQLADWCAVDLLGESGQIERVAVHHNDPSKLALAERLASEYPYDLSEPAGVARVIREGASILAPELPPEALAAYAHDQAHHKLLAEVGMTAAIVVPMVAAGKVMGAITLASAESSRRLGQQELELMEELGRRAGVAVENARLYTERTRIAQTLQRALLPESLPRIPGVELDALYTAAGELNEVGGDFYDVFPYGEDRWMLVIGDVCGKGPRAAGVTALARYTLRAAAISGQRPVQMLTTLHRSLLLQPPMSDLCTVCLVTLDMSEQTPCLSVALAGHPPPLLIKAAGDIGQVGRMGTLLGVVEPLDVREMRLALGEGDTLLLYTDGVIDAGADGEVIGEDGLRRLCSGAVGTALPTLLRRIEKAALRQSRGRLRDDVALLAVRLGSGGQPLDAEVPAEDLQVAP